MRIDLTTKVLLSLIALCVFPLTVVGFAAEDAGGRVEAPPPASQQERDLHGRVVEIDGERVKIALEGDLAPAVGDVVTLRRPVEGLTMLADLMGTWKVTTIDGRTIWAEPEPGAQGVPNLECSAVVRTASATPVTEGTSPEPPSEVAGRISAWGPGVGMTLAPVRIHEVEPVYPELARKARQQCTVVVEISINTAGDVVDPRVLKSCGNGVGMGLDAAALDAVRQWKYRPALLEGQPVVSTVVAAITFSLERRSPVQ